MNNIRIKVKIPQKEENLFLEKKSKNNIKIVFCFFIALISIAYFTLKSSPELLAEDSGRISNKKIIYMGEENKFKVEDKNNNVSNEVFKVEVIKKENIALKPIIKLKEKEESVIEKNIKDENNIIEKHDIILKNELDNKKDKPDYFKEHGFTSGVHLEGDKKREPFPYIKEFNKDLDRVYYYMELNNLKNKTLLLKWYVNDKFSFEKEIKPKFDRWRTWFYKTNTNSIKTHKIKLFLKEYEEKIILEDEIKRR